MTAQYLLRFDDICPTMNWSAWAAAERVLKKLGARPLMAIVPDNRDPSLAIDQPRKDFWEQARLWQSWGWTIGLHGWRHLYETRQSGLVGLRNKSEFAGLPRSNQLEKLQRAMHLFTGQEIQPACFVPPGHSLDSLTLELLKEIGLSTVSDGFFLRPGCDEMGILWVPQQLWRIRDLPWGVWTVCLHVNHWQANEIAAFEKSACAIAERLTTFDTVQRAFSGRKLGTLDYMQAGLLRTLVCLKVGAKQKKP